MFVESLALVLRSVVPTLAILACSCAGPVGTERPKQSRHDFLAVLIDTASKKPVPSARIILAPKKKRKLECTIDTSLTGVSNDRGEVLIPNVEPGEYVVFYNVSASLNPGLKEKVVNYDTTGWNGDGPANTWAISRSLGQKTSTRMTFFNGKLASNEHIYAWDFDLAMIALPEGELLKVRIPGSGSAPVRVEIDTDLFKTDLSPRAHKTGQ
jgi:hypothetical protein